MFPSHRLENRQTSNLPCRLFLEHRRPVMTFRRSAPVALILAVVVIVTAAAVITSRLFAGMTDAVEADQFRTMQAIVETAIRDAENKALARAELIADLPV